MRNTAETNNPPSSPFSVFFLPEAGKGGIITSPFDRLFPAKGRQGRSGGILVLTNSKGISVLFLIVAMLLMMTIGYVLSYLIPTKQKSVLFPIYSNQAFFIAQSGVEFAVRYAIDNCWTTTTELNDNLNGTTKNLGSGRFGLTYNFATYGDKLISVGEVPVNTERRKIVVSNFTSFLTRLAITYFNSASTPADNETNNNRYTAVTPPGSMQKGDLILMIGQARASSGTLAIYNAGGQSWTPETQQNQTNCRVRLFWCTFNGTWSANPSVDLGGNNNNTVVMHVFRPINPCSVWAVDVAQVSNNFSAPSSPYTVTISGISTNTDGALVFAAWATADDNTWGSLTGGWSTPGSAQYRNTFGQDASQTHAYKVMATAGASGNVSKNQTANGGDAGARLIIAFKET